MSNARVPSIDLKRLLANAQLPALPQSAIRLLELSQNPNSGPSEFAVPIECDPGLTGQVLRFVNSSYFGFSREISTVKHAITLVGVRTIKNFALWSAVFSLMPNPKCGLLDLKSLWQDSLRRALFARTMGKLLGMKDAEEPFSAALLQDMAIPVLAKEIPDVYAKLLASREHGKRGLSAIESQILAWTHGQAGAMMARQWNLPEEFATLIESHARIDEYLEQPTTELGRLAVAVSAMLPPISDPTWVECEKFEACYARYCPAGGPTVEEMLHGIDVEFAAFAPVLKLANPNKSLADCYRETIAATPAS